MRSSKIAPYVFLLLLLAITLWMSQSEGDEARIKPKNDITKTEQVLNRDPDKIFYSKHARCRMECRHVSEQEVKYVLSNGKINYNKSSIEYENCKTKYAVEAVSTDKQRLRIIFAPCEEDVTVVTVIDLETDWQCQCE